ncbi:MAG: acyl carrier protein [Kiritimatiellia bacterium]|jgi:acyl carrier protein
MNALDLEMRIKTMVSECSAVPAADIELEHDLYLDLGMDSVSSMELIGLLDEQLRLEIEIEESVGIKTVQQILDLVKKQLEGNLDAV